MENFGHTFIKVIDRSYDQRRRCSECGLMAAYTSIFNESEGLKYYIDPIYGDGFYNGMDILNITCAEYIIKKLLE